MPEGAHIYYSSQSNVGTVDLPVMLASLEYNGQVQTGVRGNNALYSLEVLEGNCQITEDGLCQATDAGTYKVRATLKDSSDKWYGGVEGLSYDMEWSIVPKELSVTIEGQGIAYGEWIDPSKFSVSGFVGDAAPEGYVAPTLAVYDIASGEEIADASALEDGHDYKLALKGGNATANYVFGGAEGVLTVGTATVVTRPADDVEQTETIVYDGKPHGLNVTAAEGYDIVYLFGTGKIAPDSEVQEVSGVPVDAGGYTVAAKVKNGYKWSDADANSSKYRAICYSWQIRKRPLVITTLDQTIPYGGTLDQTKISYEGLVEGETLESAGITLPGIKLYGTNTTVIFFSTEFAASGNPGKNYSFDRHNTGKLTVLPPEVGFSALDAAATTALMSLKVGGEAVSVDLTYTGRPGNVPETDVTIEGDDGKVEASYDLKEGKLTVSPRAAGSGVLRVKVAASGDYPEAVATVPFAVASADVPEQQTAAFAPLSEEAKALLAALKVGGDSVVIDVVYTGRDDIAEGDVSLADSGLVQLSYDLGAKKLTVTPKAAGSGTASMTFKGNAAWTDAVLDVPVTVSAADKPSIGEGEHVDLVMGSGKVYDIKNTANDGRIGYEIASGADFITATLSSDGKTLTVAPKAVGEASVRAWIEAVGNVPASDAATWTFSVKAAEPGKKEVKSLDAVTLVEKTKGSAPVEFKDAEGNVVSASDITVQSSDESVAKATYADGTLTVEGIAPGQAVITLSSDKLDADYQVTVTVTAAQGTDDGSGNKASAADTSGLNKAGTGLSKTGDEAMALVLGSLCVIAVAGVSIGVNARSRKPRVASGDTECVKDEKTD